MSDAYITKTAHFLPNNPVSNDEMEEYLGQICHKSSRAKAIVLRNNRIINRHYALTKEGKLTHSNAELAAESIYRLFDDSFQISDLELLSVGTSSPDTIMPSHGLLVHTILKGVGSIPVYSSAGVCCSSMHALTAAYHSLQAGTANNAVCAGSELLSPILRSDFFELESDKLHELNENAVIAFEKDFLRFMLSDGSGAFLLEKKPRRGLSFKIEYIDSISYANLLPACMYQGCIKDVEGNLVSWKIMDPHEWSDNSVFAIKQDTRILENIIPYSVSFIELFLKKYDVDAGEVRHFLPHISSMYFYEKLVQGIRDKKINMPEDIFYTCLTRTGNIGSASIYATLDLLTKEKKLNHGELIMLGVPESAQFQYTIALLRVVEH